VNARLRALELYVPNWVARTAVARLFEATGSAFGRPCGGVRGLGRAALLERYVRFTAGCAEDALRAGGDVPEISRRLWDNAHALGRRLRQLLDIRTRDEALRAARIAYAAIGIDLHVDRSGTVVVDRCPFAAVYAPSTCRLMSALDAGLVAGLTSGGRLTFVERITEGRAGCLGRITWEETAA
jgi:hypothetical protein